MTAAELRDAALAELRETTRGLKGFTPPASSHWGKALAILDQIGQPPPPGPEPPPVGTGELGICLNKSPSAAWLQKAASLKPKWCREDWITQEKLDWAKANGVKFIGTCNLARLGLAAAKQKVDLWGGQISRWELDNEPYFDGVTVSVWANEALQLAQYIRAKFPGHEIILPMLVQTNGGDYLTDGRWSPWSLQVLDAAPGLKTAVDASSGHPYQPGKPPATVLSVVDKVQAQLKSRGFDKPWHMTEFGWSVGTGGTPPNTQVSAANQAQYLKDVITGMRTRPWIASMEVYSLMSWGTGYEASFGLFNPDGSKRPAADVYRGLV